MAIRIITDSSADFDAAVAKCRRIDVVSMSIQFGSASFLDGKTLTSELFYKLLKEGKENPCTSQPTPADFLHLFEAARAAGEQVVVVTLSSVLSGTYQSAAIARDMCGGGDAIHLVDSRSATAGIRILVNYACKLRDSGFPAGDIAGALEELKDRIRIIAVIDTLEYLRRGGRLSSLEAGIGTMAKLKPVIAVREGAVSVVGKAFGTAAAVKRLLGMLEEAPIDDAFPSYFLYSDDKSREELLLPRMREAGILPQRLHACSIGATIGTHVGPGALGLAYVERR